VQRVPQTRELAFVDKRDGDNWLITYLDLDSMTVTRALPTLPGREDFALAADGSILMAQGGRLYRGFPGEQGWELLADWDATLPGDISRIAVSPTGRHLAFVVWEEPGE
jgi:hypothetical protein